MAPVGSGAVQLEVRVSEEMESVWLCQRRVVCARLVRGARSRIAIADGISVCHTFIDSVYSYIYRENCHKNTLCS